MLRSEGYFLHLRIQVSVNPSKHTYVLSIRFGVLALPKVTLYGVWKGKGGQARQGEQLAVECRSPALGSLVERDIAILSPTR